VGSFVHQGDKIGEQGDVGWTGGNGRDDVPCNGKTLNSKCGVHLHFGVHKGQYWNSQTVQPRFQDVFASTGSWFVSSNQTYQSGNCGGGGSCGLTSIPSGYNHCADENGRCNFSGTAEVIYGANNCYTSPRTFSNGVDCNNNVFVDVVPGVPKKCYYKPTSSGGNCGITSVPSGYRFCADEGGFCNFTGTASVVYGESNCYTSPRSFTNGVNCNNDIFLDPLPGVRKKCYTDGSSGSTPSGDWHVEYFNSLDFCSRCYDNYEGGTYIFKYWGTNSPANGCNSDNFSARFTRTLNFPGGYYSFHCHHDDGCSIFVDGQLKLNAWWDSNFDGHDWGGNLSAGNHEVKVEFYEKGDKARLEAYWAGPGFLPFDSGCNANEWCASYYGNRYLDGRAVFNRNEGSGFINQVWNNDGPGYGFPTDNFSVRWVRNLNLTPGLYRFHIRVDDGGRLFVNNQVVIDQWKDQPETEYTADVTITSESTPVKFEYYENGGGAIAKLWWEALRVVPSQPTNFRIESVSPSSITLAWDDVSGEEGYRIYKWGYDGNEYKFLLYQTVGANVTKFTDNDLNCEDNFNFYEISAYNSFGESSHTGWLQATTADCPAPPNDDIQTPTSIDVLPFSNVILVDRATQDPSDPPLTKCNLPAGDHTVWYQFHLWRSSSWSPILSTPIHIDTYGSNYDTILGVWSGTPGNLELIDCNDDSNGSLQSSLNLLIPSHGGYYISVAKYRSNANSSINSQKFLDSSQNERLTLVLSVSNYPFSIFLPMLKK